MNEYPDLKALVGKDNYLPDVICMLKNLGQTKQVCATKKAEKIMHSERKVCCVFSVNYNLSSFRYLAAKSEADHYNTEYKREQEEIINVPDTEAAEVIFGEGEMFKYSHRGRIIQIFNFEEDSITRGLYFLIELDEVMNYPI